MTISLLEGPRLAPLKRLAPKQLIVLLHGRGSNGADLLELGREFQEALPEAEFFAPNAPLPFEYFGGYEWFNFTFKDAPEKIAEVIQESATLLIKTIEKALKAHTLTNTDLAFVGFSQGAMMALHTALYYFPCAAVVGYSGAFIPSSTPLLKPSSPVLLVHGEQDSVIPVEAFFEAKEKLEESAVPLETYLSPSLGHGIDEQGIFLAKNFLKSHF